MAHVIVQVNGRPYTMQCPEGEEPHLKDLAELLDSEVQRVKTSVGNVGDIRMLVMAGLMLSPSNDSLDYIASSGQVTAFCCLSWTSTAIAPK